MSAQRSQVQTTQPTTCSSGQSRRLAPVVLGVLLACVSLGAACVQALPAQTFVPVPVVTTVAGDGTQAGNGTLLDTGDEGPATQAAVGKPDGVVVDKAGNIYIAATATHVIRKVDTNGIIHTIAGTSGTSGHTGDGGPAANALLNQPWGLALDTNGNLLIVDYGNHAIRKIDENGVITTIAGIPGSNGFTGDNGLATKAKLKTPSAIAVDPAGNLYIADYGNLRVRKVDTNGIISTVAGTGASGFTGDGGPATDAAVRAFGIWVDLHGNLLLADRVNNVIRKIDPSGTITTLAGTAGTAGTADGSADSASFSSPTAVVSDAVGNIYVADEGNSMIRKIDTNGNVTTVMGRLGRGFAGDGGPASEGKEAFGYALALDSNDNLYFPDASNYRVRKISLNTVLSPASVGASSTQKLFVESELDVTPDSVSVVPSAPESFVVGALDGCSLGTSLAANTPCAVSVTFQPVAPGLQTARILFSDSNGTISNIGVAGVGIAPQTTFGNAPISAVAGNGVPGNGGSAVSAPRGGVIDSAGNIYFADSGNNLIRRIDAVTGAISTVAGTGTPGYAGDGGDAASAQLNAPSKVAMDGAGNLYIADTGNSVIRYVDAATKIISTIAGNGNPGYDGDGGLATSASLNHPQGLAVDLAGHVYVADTGNHAIRFFAKGGAMTTLTGTGAAGYAGDGGNAYGATLNAPQAVTLDLKGNIYIADTGNDVVRVISATNQISTVAGQQGEAANAGDGGTATAATLQQPSDIGLDAAGDIYIAAGGQVRLVDTSGLISTIAGTGAAGDYSGEGGAATSAILPSPISNLMLDSAGNMVLSATAGNRVLKVAGGVAATLDLGVQSPGATGVTRTVSVLNTGNSSLNLSGLNVTSNFTLQTGNATDCIASTVLAAGQSCAIRVAFSPGADQLGSVNGSIAITDNSLNGSNVSHSVPLVGLAKVVANTATSVSVSPASLVYGTAANITAAVSNGSTPTGTVTFSLNGKIVGSAQLDNSGKATYSIQGLPAGTTSILASYEGDSNNGSSSGAANIEVQPAVLTVTAADSTMVQGGSIPSLTYAITGFVNGDTNAVVSGAPTETTTATSSSAVGSYPITLGQGSLTAASYTFVFVNGTLTIQAPPPADYKFSITSASESMSSANPVLSFTVTVTPANGYSGNVNLSCGELPANVSCTFDGGPIMQVSAGTAATRNLLIWTANPTAVAENRASGGRAEILLSGAMPLSLVWLAFYRRRNRRWLTGCLGMLCLAVLSSGLTSCGGSKSVTQSTTLSPGQYQVTVTAADATSNLSHSEVVTFTVQ